jgi:SAM-dependent methyltransferase
MKEKEIINDSIYWDVFNWSKSLSFWENNLNMNTNKIKALELGCSENGGLSLWLASKGCEVNCSGYEQISRKTIEIHNTYTLPGSIKYNQIDALSIPYKEFYDIICFKSMLGGIVRCRSLEVARKVISEIHKALKPGGTLLFAENLSGTMIHRFLRTKYGALKNNWRYFEIEELKDLFSDYSSFNYTTFGFLGCFGRTEKQKKIFGKIDSILFDTLNEKFHYIIACIAIK